MSVASDCPKLRQLAETTFKKATFRLQETVSCEAAKRRKGIRFPDFSFNGDLGSAVSEVETILEKLLEALNVEESAKPRSEIIGNIITQWFRASYPFLRLFLSVGVTGSAVFNVCYSFAYSRFLH